MLQAPRGSVLKGRHAGINETNPTNSILVLPPIGRSASLMLSKLLSVLPHKSPAGLPFVWDSRCRLPKKGIPSRKIVLRGVSTRCYNRTPPSYLYRLGFPSGMGTGR